MQTTSGCGVKHLNPRQGITTEEGVLIHEYEWIGVKHLNPRQGITTPSLIAVSSARSALIGCETPKSPPGDYNRTAIDIQATPYDGV